MLQHLGVVPQVVLVVVDVDSTIIPVVALVVPLQEALVT
jgi:hypothetical protein